MQHFADDNYDIEKAIARYEGLPFLLKKADLEVGRADLDPYTPEDQHFLPNPEPNLEPAAAPAVGGPQCPLCGSFNTALFDEFNLHCFDCNRQSSLEVVDNSRFGKNKCECWEGYKRVPGTKPCAPGSCEKCDSHSKKSSDLNSQPFANPVPLADAPGTTPGNKPINEVLEAAPSAVGTGVTAAAHTVEKKGDKFFVVEDKGEKAAGPFDSQEEAYARANKLNDLENLEKETKVTSFVIHSNFINEIVNAYSQHPEFAQTVAQSLLHALRATGQIVDQVLRSGISFDQIKNYIRPIFDKWKKGEIELDDIDQIVLGMNIFGQSNPNLLGGGNQQIIAKFASQGDKPSPHAAQAVFEALAGGNEDEAKELLKQTDCPKGCETHPEGKCNHGFMSAGRTRVRYLVSNKPFGNEDTHTESVE